MWPHICDFSIIKKKTRYSESFQPCHAVTRDNARNVPNGQCLRVAPEKRIRYVNHKAFAVCFIRVWCKCSNMWLRHTLPLVLFYQLCFLVVI